MFTFDREGNGRMAAPLIPGVEQNHNIRVEQSPGMTTAIAGLLLLTLVLRITVIVVDGGRLHTDPDAYIGLATMLADGQGYSTANGICPTAFRPILYPLLLAGPLALGTSPAVSVALWNLFSGLLLVVAVIGLAMEIKLNRTETLAAGFMAAVDPLLIRYTTEPMTENVSAALFTISLIYLLRFFSQSSLVVPPTHFTTGAKAGLLLGLCTLCRPIILISCLLMSVTMTILRWKSVRKHHPNVIGHTAWMWLPAVLATVTLSPWVIRNAVQFGALIPATTHGGYTLLLGNNSEFYTRVVTGKQHVWDGVSLEAWQRSLQQQMNHAGIDLSDERAVDQWMYQRAKSEMLNEPAMAVRAMLLRWRRFCALTPTGTGRTLPQWVIYLTGTWYGLLGTGLLASLLRLRRNSTVLLLWTSIASFLIVHSFYWTNTRMRAPLTGVLVVLVITGWAALPHRLLSRKAN